MVWFVVLLVPSAMLVMLDLGEPMAEHRVYLASAGMFLAVGTMFGRAWPLFGTRVFRYGVLCKFLLAAWLTVLGGMTVLRNEVWANPVHLWLSAVQQAPDIWVPHVALGESLQNVGSHDAAVAEYRLAIHASADRARALHEAGAGPGRAAPAGRSARGSSGSSNA